MNEFDVYFFPYLETTSCILTFFVVVVLPLVDASSGSDEGEDSEDSDSRDVTSYTCQNCCTTSKTNFKSTWNLLGVYYL